tara:strand:- start:9176 stop:10684 length:1509 start_codon:yes stop_codon:yes gene_type:complete
MANLKALREKVKNITDYSPELQQFNDQLDELINDAYYCIWTMKRWNFATELDFLRFHVDITATTDLENAVTTAVYLAVNRGERKVTLSAGIDRLHDPDIWEGQPIEIDTMEYTISKVLSVTELLLTEAYKGTTYTLGDKYTGWKIKKRFYDLPENCLELLYLGHRDYPYTSVTGSQNPYGKSTAILPRREEDLDLRVDYANSYAEAYITTPTIDIPPAENIKLEESETAGNFVTGKHYEICWAFLKDGKVGGLSEPKVYTIANNNKGIKVSFLGWDDLVIQADTYNTADKVATQWEGYRKVVYWNKNFDQNTGERKGLPCWLAVTKGGGTRNSSAYLEVAISPDTSAFQEILNINQLDNGSKRYIEIDGLHQQIRPYPRVNGFDFEVVQIKDGGGTITTFHDYVREGIMRIYKKPQDLLLSTDVPQMPYEFHQLIVYKALEDIYLKLGQQQLATTYERKYLKEITVLAKRYVDKVDQRVRRGQFHFAHSRPTYDGTTLRRLP